VYQGIGRGLDLSSVKAINSFAVGRTSPDLTILLDLDVEVGHARAREASGGKEDRMEAQPMDFFRLVRQGYLDLAKEEPNRIAVIDASLSIDEVTESIKEEFADRLGEVEA
jgi:dTMP kinase